MGDVTMLCRMILGYNPVIPEADINGDGEVNMGDVVFTERVILGLSKVGVEKTTMEFKEVMK